MFSRQQALFKSIFLQFSKIQLEILVRQCPWQLLATGSHSTYPEKKKKKKKKTLSLRARPTLHALRRAPRT